MIWLKPCSCRREWSWCRWSLDCRCGRRWRRSTWTWPTVWALRYRRWRWGWGSFCGTRGRIHAGPWGAIRPAAILRFGTRTGRPVRPNRPVSLWTAPRSSPRRSRWLSVQLCWPALGFRTTPQAAPIRRKKKRKTTTSKLRKIEKIPWNCLPETINNHEKSWKIAKKTFNSQKAVNNYKKIL